MTAHPPLLDIRDLHVSFKTSMGTVPILCGVDLAISKGEIVGLVGESGSGKSLTALAVMGLLGPSGERVQGTLVFNGIPLHELDDKALRQIRGKRIGMIFQEPMRSFNPTLTIGQQVGEMLRTHKSYSRAEARKETIDLLRSVGIAAPESRVDSYPFQLSGGMCQRAAIAMALACGPDLLIADEPTTALDVTVQAQILALLKKIQEESGMGLLLITHDLGVVASLCDRVAVMNRGKIIEDSPVDLLFKHPLHPYTYALLQAKMEGAAV